MFAHRKPTRLRLAWCLAVCLLWAGCDSPAVPSVASNTGTVDLVIDYNGRKPNQQLEIPIHPESTVLTVLQRAQKTGDIQFDVRGDREGAFVSAIGGVANEKAAGDNWTFRVNDELGNRSCGVFSVKAGDRILWLFGKYP